MKIKKDDNLWSKEAEAGVIGSMIIEPSCIGKILPIVDRDSFYLPEHRQVFDALVELYTSDSQIDGVLLRTELKKRNQLDDVGGVEYLAKVMESVPSTANVDYYSSIVRDRKRYRELIQTVTEMGKVFNEPLRVDEQVEQIQSLAMGLEKESPSGFYELADVAEQIASEPEGEEQVYGTGFRNLDHIIEGAKPGELIVLAARPTMGKSALALQIALNMAGSGLSCVYFTLEMTHRELTHRALTNNQLEQLRAMTVGIHEACRTPEQAISFIRSRKQLNRLDVVFVDYLQLMSTGRKSENRVQEIATISRRLKLAAIKEDVPIIVLSQLNRQVEGREKHRPRLSDLRESGSIEQDADIVLLLKREDYYRKNDDPDAPMDGSAELIVAKNRRGPTGIAKLVFLDKKVKFGDAIPF